MINQHLHTKIILLAIVVAVVVLPHSEAFQSSLSSSCLSIRTSHLLRAEEQWTGEVVAGKWVFLYVLALIHKMCSYLNSFHQTKTR